MPSLSFQRLTPQGPSLEELYRNIQTELALVEEELQKLPRSSNRLIKEINSYLFHKGGKRIRPALLILAAKLFGYDGNDHILMATAIESIHTASLIHDDIIDNSALRRGKESVHARWGANITVLLGDYLYIKTIGLSIRNDNNGIIRLLSEASAQMIEGEIMEYDFSRNADITEREYFHIIRNKTAGLFAAACRIGGILSRASEADLGRLSDYGVGLGMTFQIIDDLLDFIGDPDLMGKPILSDLGEGRITLPMIYALRQDGRAHRDRLLDMITGRPLGDAAKREILEILRDSGALAYAYRKAEECAARSREAVSGLPDSPHRATLGQMSDFVLIRNT
jgi:octaprenyl-diphosphate synthase